MDLFYTETHHQKNKINKQSKPIINSENSKLLSKRLGQLQQKKKPLLRILTKSNVCKGRCFLSLKSCNFIFICVLDSSNDLGTA